MQSLLYKHAYQTRALYLNTMQREPLQQLNNFLKEDEYSKTPRAKRRRESKGKKVRTSSFDDRQATEEYLLTLKSALKEVIQENTKVRSQYS